MNESDTDLRKAIRDKETALEPSKTEKMGTNKKKGTRLIVKGRELGILTPRSQQPKPIRIRSQGRIKN